MFIKGPVYVILMSAQTLTPPPPPPRVRPTGVTILAILGFIGAALFIFAGIALVALGPLILSIMGESMSHPFLALIAGGLDVFLFVLGGIELVISWGLWTGRGWAWWLTVIFSALSLLLSLVFLALMFLTPSLLPPFNLYSELNSLMTNILTLIYLFTPHVKDYFGVKVSFST